MSTLHDVLGIVMPMVTLLCGCGGPLFGYSVYRRAKQHALQVRYALRIALYYTIALECIALMALLFWIGRATGLHIVQDVFALTIVPLLVAAQVMRNRAEKLETLSDRTASLNR